MSIAMAALAGCASSGPKVVRVPVPVTCVKEEPPAEPEMIGGKLTGNAEADIGTVGASAIRLRSWGRELRAMIEGCRG